MSNADVVTPLRSFAAKITTREGVSFWVATDSEAGANGLQNKIILYEGKILDGRNRYEACQIAGITPEYEEYKGDDPIAYIVSLNLHRRHLSESQRAVVASRLANMERQDTLKQGSRPADLPIGKISQPEAAKMLNVSERLIRDVREVERAAPEYIPRIEAGG